MGIPPRFPGDEQLLKLADLAQVPDGGARNYFNWLILDILFDAWEDDELRNSERVVGSDPSLSRTIKALRVAKQALANLEKPVREGLCWPIYEIEKGIDRFFESTVGAAEPTKPRVHRRGRREGTLKNRGFQNFIRSLFKAARICHGNFSLEKNIRAGGIIQAIDILAPYLPDGVVPRYLPVSTLQRIKSTLNREWGHRTNK
jgi:hypothetical protein